jgi:hypothetical protein
LNYGVFYSVIISGLNVYWMCECILIINK